MLRLGPTATLLGRNYSLDPCSGHLEAVEIRDLVAGTACTACPSNWPPCGQNKLSAAENTARPSGESHVLYVAELPSCSDLGLRCTIVPRCSIPAGVSGLTLCSIKVGPISHGYTTANRFTPQADIGQLHLPHSASRDVKDIIAPRGMVLQDYPRRIALPCGLWSVFCVPTIEAFCHMWSPAKSDRKTIREGLEEWRNGRLSLKFGSTFATVPRTMVGKCRSAVRSPNYSSGSSVRVTGICPLFACPTPFQIMKVACPNRF
jgi:hypothetical protein